MSCRADGESSFEGVSFGLDELVRSFLGIEFLILPGSYTGLHFIIFLRKKLTYFFLVIALFGGWEGYAQEYEVFPREEYYGSGQQERAFSGVHWLEVTEDIDYRESVRAERTEDENFFTDGEEKKRNRRIYDGQNNSGSEFWSIMLKFLILALGIGIVAIIIARFLGPEGLNKPRSRKVGASELEVNLKNIEDNIHESNLEKFIQQAQTENNYNLAIRLYYLAIIKELSLAKVIRWKRDKTNRNYVQEVQGQEYLDAFKKLTTIFERGWYGNRTLNKIDYQRLQPQFEDLITQIKTLAQQATINPPHE